MKHFCQNAIEKLIKKHATDKTWLQKFKFWITTTKFPKTNNFEFVSVNVDVNVPTLNSIFSSHTCFNKIDIDIAGIKVFFDEIMHEEKDKQSKIEEEIENYINSSGFNIA